MAVPRFARKRALFEQALRLPQPERHDFLALECDGDLELLDEVERLLSADLADAPALDLTFSQLTDLLGENLASQPLPFPICGEYRLVRCLGAGGMGEVFLAERLDNGNRVALKILTPESVQTPEIVCRFEREKEILGRLRHPNIARFYHSGISFERPWFAMDFIEGSPITAFCEAKSLPLRPRLELMRKLCDAVAHAHGRNIVHCDLTPNNVLVTDDSEPHLVDFGIARVLHDQPARPRTAVATARPYSIPYASPEQIRNRPLDTRTDIWSLGAVFYTLLSGCPPFAGDGILAERAIEEKILNENPSRPSAAALANGRPASFASSSEWKELDALCLWALQKDPEKRCRAAQLRDDIERFLTSQPLEARSAGWFYRARKIAGRRKAGAIDVCVAAVLVAVLLAGNHNTPPVLTWTSLTKAVHPASRIASDGKSVFWTECDASGCRPWQAPVGNGASGVGADPAPIFSPFTNAFVMDAGPENQLLLAVSETPGIVGVRGLQGALWELNISTGGTKRVGNLTPNDAAWSQDKTRLAFVHWNELWLADRDGSSPHCLATLPGAILNTHWSPDGRLLRFSIHPNTEYRYPLWEVETETGRARPVLPEWSEGSEQGGAWTASGNFVFGAERASGSDLWRLIPATSPAIGHRLEQMTRGPLEFSQPINIPGRDELAVIGARKQGELVRYDSRLGGFTPYLNGISAEMADFSGDGKWVVYVTYPERTLWRSSTDGTQTLQLTRAPLRAGLPRISPDAQQVAFTGDYAGKEMRTWLVPFDGGEPRPATELAPQTAEVAPTWSPDGKQLLFRLDRAIRNNVLQILDLKSGRIETVPNSAQKFNQRWSPDGKWLAATPNDEAGLDLFSLTTFRWTRLTATRADYPNWSHNSNFLYFCTRLDSGEQAVDRVSIASGKTERVTTLAGVTPVLDETYGQWLGLGPGDSPVILRSADLRQIYRLSLAK